MRRIIAAHQNTTGTRNNVLPREHHGPINLGDVRPAPTECPKMVYKASKVDPQGYITRILKWQEEQDALPKGWLTTAKDVHALLDPIAKAQYLTADDLEGDELEEKEGSKQVKEAAKGK
jgi:hypothetical protein